MVDVLHRPAGLLLELDLTSDVLESVPADPLAAVQARGKPRLRTIVERLRDAAADGRVRGLVAKVGACSLPLARAQEIRDAVRAFAATGRPTVAWAESFAEFGPATVAYYLASGFGEVWVQPSGAVGLTGFAAEPLFVRGLLDRVGIEPQVEQRHEYKNAADLFVRREMTDAHREALARLTESATEQVVAGVAAARGLSVTAVRALVDAAPLTPTEAHDGGLVDHVGYRDEVYANVRDRLGPQITLVFLDRYQPPRRLLDAVRRRVAARRTGAVALVSGHGGIVTGRSRRSGVMGQVMGSDTVSAALRAAVADEHVKAIVFRVDSPGGSYVASDTVWRHVELARSAGKPVVVSMGAVVGSGGYFVACGADVIVAQPGTLTGSIGVFGGKPVVTGLLDRLGVTTARVEAGRHAAMFSPRRSFTDTEWERLAGWLDRVYDDFVGKVAVGRGMTRDRVHDLARGRVWTGADAHDIGLVDELGGLEQAAAIARARAHLPDDAPVRPVPRVSPLGRLRPPRSSEDPRASLAESGWGPFRDLALALGLPAAGPLTMPGAALPG